MVLDSLVMLGGCRGNQPCEDPAVSLQSHLLFPTSGEGKETELTLVPRANGLKPLQPFKETGRKKLLDLQQPVSWRMLQRGREAHMGCLQHKSVHISTSMSSGVGQLQKWEESEEGSRNSDS